MQLSFHSILASNQEVDFFTDILLETDLPGELDHSTLATLESVPEEVLQEEEAAAIEEQFVIEMAYDEEYLKSEYSVVITDHTNNVAEVQFGTWEECKAFVDSYSKLFFGHRFDARFFSYYNDNEVAAVQFFPTKSNPTGYITLIKPRSE